jgi:ArsR family transcriptional regulator
LYIEAVILMSKISGDFEGMARKFKALSHPERLKMVTGLMRGECCAGDIQQCVSLSQPHVSQSLKVLKRAGIIQSRREKTRICYRIVDERLAQALKILWEGEES